MRSIFGKKWEEYVEIKEEDKEEVGCGDNLCSFYLFFGFLAGREEYVEIKAEEVDCGTIYADPGSRNLLSSEVSSRISFLPAHHQLL